MTEAIEYLSFGAGPPSLALAILDAWGEIEPRAQVVMWADTGWEKQETYRLLPVYENWIAEMGMDFVNVQAAEGPLQDYIRSRSVPIPVHTENAIGKRQCTDKWKIAPIEKYLHGRFGRDVPLIAQLGLQFIEFLDERGGRLASHGGLHVFHRLSDTSNPVTKLLDLRRGAAIRRNGRRRRPKWGRRSPAWLPVAAF